MGNVCSSDDKRNETVEKVSLHTDQKKEEEPVQSAQAEVGEPKLLVTIVGARGLRNSDWLPGSGKPDCYCEVKTGSNVLYTTGVVNDKCEPVWAEECKVTEIEDSVPLEFHIFDKDLIGSDFLGKAVLEPKDYAEEGWNGEIKLADSKVPQAYIKVKVKLAGKALPPGPAPEYTVEIEKPGKDKSFGLDLDTQDGNRLHVLEVKAGPFNDYNGNAKPEIQVKPTDVIMSVNDVSSSSEDMVKQFKEEVKVKCVIRRAVLSVIIFDRPEGTPLGLEFTDKPQGDFLVIKGIVAGGAAETFNNNAAKEQDKLCVGDRIVSVAGKKKVKAMQAAFEEKNAGKVQLAILRPAMLKPEGGEGGGLLHWLFD